MDHRRARCVQPSRLLSQTPSLVVAYGHLLICACWTAGPPYDLQILEVRSDSLVLLWKAPVYQGRDPVNGFYVDMKEAEAPHEAWRGVNNKAMEKIFMKVLHR